MNAFSVLVKPASSLCNMRCSYCFYHSTSSTRKNFSYGLMSHETAHNLIDRAFSYKPEPFAVSFLFQGGEPTLAGLDFFEDFTKYAAEKLPAGCEIKYSIQTNGLLLDSSFCDFFKKNQFLLGLSLDGDKAIHDLLRKDADGKGTFTRVITAAKLLDKTSVDFNILTVVTKTVVRHIRSIWNEYEKNGFKYLQFIPCLPPFDGSTDKFSLTPQLYSDFLKESFTLYANSIKHGKYVSVRFFDNLILLLKGNRAEQCGLNGRCSFQFVTEANGGIYPCDFYCMDKYLCGNVNDELFSEIESSQKAMSFLGNSAAWSSLCKECGYKSICGAGCKRYQSFYFSSPDFCPHKEFLNYAMRELQTISRYL
ncbi:MAG: SPASM domain-containing protein [Bacillota bacterium]|nr:SPASM domain-containing protein [Bacillota bacterium]